jgi:hypothetical protein
MNDRYDENTNLMYGSHVCRIPSKIKNAIGLTAMQCQPASELSLLEEKDLNLLKQQVGCEAHCKTHQQQEQESGQQQRQHTCRAQ